eukprot:775858-Alexandrium_andersonii.AAC.1
MSAKFGVPSCGLKARRAPEVACGDLRRLVDRLFDEGLADIVHRIGHDCTAEQRNTLVTAYTSGRRHLSFTLFLKLSSWLHLPLAMAGMAHHQEVVARRQMQRCIEMFDAAPAPERLHPMCRTLLDPASPVRQQLAA